MIKNLTYLVVAALSLTLLNPAKAQQEPHYTHYMFNTIAVNPAYAGSREALSVMGLTRHQWVNIEGAPSTQVFSVNSPVFQDQAGAGLTFVSDAVGPIKQTMVHVDFAYRMQVSEKASLAVGLKGGINTYQANLSDLMTIVPDASMVNIESKAMPNVGAGVYYKSDLFFAGLSTPNFLNNRFENGEIKTDRDGKDQHYYLILGSKLDLNPTVEFHPTFMAKQTTGAPLSMDLTFNFYIDKAVWLGGMFRFGDSFGALLGYQFTPDFRLGYSYDMTSSRYASYNNGSHEIVLLWDIRLKKKDTGESSL